MQLRRNGRTARQKEITVLCQPGSHGIHFLFAAYGQSGGRKKIRIQYIIGSSHMAHHYHQFLLNSVQQFLPVIPGREHGTHNAYHSIQLVQATVCLDANIIFGDTCSAMNSGCPLVSRTGIYFFHLLFK